MPKRILTLLLLAVSSLLILGAGCGDASFQQGKIGLRLPYSTGEGAAWSPDGKWVAIPIKTGIRLRNVKTGERREIKAPTLQGFPEDPGPLSWSADGRTLRYVTSDGPREENVSWLTEVGRDGSGLRQARLPVKAQRVAWGPEGLPLAFSTGAYAIDGDRGQPIGPKPALYVTEGIDGKPRRVVQIPAGTRESELGEPAFSPDGKRLLYIRTQFHKPAIWTIRPDGSDPRILVTLGNARNAVWSPRGGLIAFLGTAVGSPRGGIGVVSASGGKPRWIAGEEEIVDGPVWSPDGRWITFSTFDAEIRRIRPDGSGGQVIAELPGEEIRALKWSPDGRRLAYMARDFPPRD
jgi:Tol biopolymer transport system component